MQEKLAKLFRKRSGAVIAGAFAAVLAVILLVVYLRSYRSSLNSGKQPERVLVATKLIKRGTSAAQIAQKNLYQVTSVQKDQLQPLAISDPSAIQGRVAAADIFPGQQLTQGDFTTEAPTSLAYQLTGPQRAIAIPVDSAHGLIGQVTAGDYVDVYVGVAGSNNLVTLLAPDILVLVAPGGSSGNAVLRINTKQAAKFAFASDNARIWLVLRPQTGATRTPPETATLASLLANAR